jgi:formylglycine-generating enzyme
MGKRIAAVVFSAAIFFVPACAGGDWISARQVEFAAWQSHHRDLESRIATLKSDTAKLLAHTGLGPVTAPPVVFRVKPAPAALWDWPQAPRMTIVPAGEFSMGSPDTEFGRQPQEGPQHRVRIAYAFAVGTYQVTRDEYAAFVADTKRPDPEGCFLTYRAHQTAETKGFNWHDPGFAQTGRDPVVCVSWEDAQAYAAWLSAGTGRTYRLLSEAEFEYAARAGTIAARYWGNAIGRADANYGSDACCAPYAEDRDRWLYTSPGGSFPPNAFGLYDMLGNTWQRLDDCWRADFEGAPADGSVWTAGDCTRRTGHGGAFDSEPSFVRAAFRGSVPQAARYADGGFRVARGL